MSTSTQEITLNIPREVSDITLGKYQEYAKLSVDASKNINTEFVKMKLVSIFCEVPMDLVRTAFSATDIDEIATKISKVLANVNPQPKGVHKPIINFKGVEFGFIPDFSKMKAGAFSDLTEYIGKFENLHNIMAILYRPVEAKMHNKILDIEQYSIETYEGTDKYADIMKFIPVEQALEASFFLVNSLTQLEATFRNSLLLRQVEKSKLVTKKVSALRRFSFSIGGGINRSTV